MFLIERIKAKLNLSYIQKYSKYTFGISLIIFALFVFRSFSNSEISLITRKEALLPGIQLFAACLLIIAFGSLISYLCKFQVRSLIWGMLSGQVVLSFWIYLRSGVSNFSKMPELAIAFDTFLIVLIAIIYWHRSLVDKLQFKISAFKFYELLIMLSICLLAAQRELPRTTVMSSDPDLHVFWASQLSNSHIIPNQFGLSGPESMKYPAGFAVLNYIWSSLSLLDLIQIVSIQSLLQSQFAVLLLSSSCAILFNLNQNRPLLSLALNFFALAIFYFALPYGYQHNFYHLEGTARTSCLFYLSALCLLPFYFFTKSQDNKVPSLFLLSVIVMLLIGINPINALYGFPCFIILSLFILRLSRRQPIVLICLLIPLILVCDPYFLSANKKNSSLDVEKTTLSASILNGLENAMSKPIEHIQRAYGGYFSVDFYPANLVQDGVLIAVLIYFFFRSKFTDRRIVEIGVVLVAISNLAVMGFIILPGLSPLSTNAQYRLIFPYSLHLSQQITLVWILFILCLISHAIFKRWGFQLFLVLCVPSLLLLRNYRDNFASIRLQPRYSVSSALGSATSDDQVVIRQIEAFSDDIKKRYPYLNADTIPKILIPNLYHDTGWEQWLYPHGATRVLPIKDTLPLAFYYNQGWEDFNYNNYLDKVCRHFDLAWLSKKNIRYIFLPDDRGPVCVKNLSRILKSENIIFKSGNSIFAKLF